MQVLILIVTFIFLASRLKSLSATFKYPNAEETLCERCAEIVKNTKVKNSDECFTFVSVVFRFMQLLIAIIIPIIYYVVTARYIGTSFIGILSGIEVLLCFINIKYVKFSDDPNDYKISWVYKYVNTVVDLIYYPFVIYFILLISANLM